LRRLLVRSIPDGTVVIAQNARDAQQLRNAGIEPAFVRPNVCVEVDTSEVRDEGSPAAPNHNLLFAGRLVSWKGVGLVLAALALLPESYTIRFVGPPTEESWARALAGRLGLSERVVFCGVLSRSETLNELRRADALVFPSFHDSAGWVVAEAASLGTRVVSLDIGGPAEIVRSIPGHVVLPLTEDLPARLAEAIERATSTAAPAPSKRWGRAALCDDVARWYGLEQRAGV
jgi:glycosyltransferase involved in cell wall biosynthesis